MDFLKNLLLFLSIVIIVFSIFPTRRLIAGLPPGRIRLHWYNMLVLIYLFAVGYVAYSVAFWGEYRSSFDLIVPTIFFFGAIFVFMVCILSLQTTDDIKKIYQLEYESTTDPLMGICNRRSMEKTLHSEFNRAKRYRHPLSLVMLDIDHFKRINDNFGHQVGDVVLKKLAALIVAAVRETDVVCRYGGEEILIIMPHTKRDDALVVAEGLRVEIESTKIITKDDGRKCDDVQVTASFGVTAIDPEVESVHCLLGRADKALYFAKKQGRNKAYSCFDLPDSDKS